MADDPETELVALFRALPEAAQAALLDNARALAAAAPPRSVVGEETVAAALRRLVRSYPMLERRRLLGAGSQLLAAHSLEGRPAAEVIAELEDLFYRQYLRAQIEKD